MAFLDKLYSKKRRDDEDEERQYDTVSSSSKSISRFEKRLKEERANGTLNYDDVEKRTNPYTHHESYNPYPDGWAVLNQTTPTTPKNTYETAMYAKTLENYLKPKRMSDGVTFEGYDPKNLTGTNTKKPFVNTYNDPRSRINLQLEPGKDLNDIEPHSYLAGNEYSKYPTELLEKAEDYYKYPGYYMAEQAAKETAARMDEKTSNLGEAFQLSGQNYLENFYNNTNKEDYALKDDNNIPWWMVPDALDNSSNPLYYKKQQYENTMESLNEADKIRDAINSRYFNSVYNAEDFDELKGYNPDGAYSDDVKNIATMLNNGSYKNLGNQYAYIRPDEIDVFNYLLNKDGEERAMEYLDLLNLKGRRTESISDLLSADAYERKGIASMAAHAVNSLSGITGTIGNFANYIAGNEIDPDAWYNLPYYATTAMRGGAAQRIKDDNILGMGEVDAYLYQVGTSMEDFVFNLASGNEALALGIMGATATESTIIEAKERGLSDGQALTLGAIAGAAEVISEKVSIEALFNSDAQGVKYILQNAFSEGGEEVESDVINDIADMFISGDKAQMRQEYQNYLNEGLSESQAFVNVVKNHAGQYVLDFAGGAISGAAMGGMGAFSKYANQTNIGNTMLSSQENLNQFVNLGLQSENEETRTLAQNVADGNKKKSIIGQLVQNVSSENNLYGRIVDNLRENGETQGMAEAEAESVMRHITGQELNAQDQEYLQKENVQNALNDVFGGIYDTSYANSETAYDAYDRALEMARQQRAEKMAPVTNAINNVRNIFGNKKSGVQNNTETENNAQVSEENTQKAEETETKETVKSMPLSERAKIGAEYSKFRTEVKPVQATLNDVKAVEVTPDGLSVTLNDGQKVKPYQITDGPTQALLSFAGSRFGDTQGAEDFIKAYNENVNAKVMLDAANEMILAGRNGADIKTAVEKVQNDASFRVNGKSIPVSFLNNMYAYGVREQKGISAKMNSKTQRAVTDLVAKGLGIENLIKEGGIKEQGSFNESTNEITFGEDTSQSRIETLAHETTHMMKKHARDTYNELEKVVLDSFKENGTYQKFYDHVKELYGEEASKELIHEEMIARAMQEMLFNENVINELCKEQPSLAKRILAAIRKAIEELRAVFHGKIGTAESHQLSQDIEALEKAEKLYAKGLKEAAASVKVENTEGKKDTGIKYSKSFAEEIDNWDKKNPYLTFDVGITSDIYEKAGVDSNKAITLDSKKLVKIISDHPEMTSAVIKKIPYAIAKPVAIVESQSEPGRLVVISDVFPMKVNGKDIPMIVALELNPVDKQGIAIDGIKVASAYGKDGITQKWINDNTYKYITPDKQKIRRWEASTRLQLPVGLLTSSKNNISNNTGKSNTISKDSEGRNLTLEQLKYFEDSKIRDKDGNLLVVYHGTPSGGFTVFKNDLNFFTANKAYADVYQDTNASARKSGKTATNPMTYEGYLNITKPFDLSDPECMKVFIDEYIKGGWALGINPYQSDAEIRKQIKDGIDWTEADNLKEFFDEEGYDYDGIILNEGGYFDNNGNVVDRGLSYVTFNSNQFKNIDNLKPTKSPDIRFSLKEPVEVTKDLIAVHNLYEENLTKAIEMGGFPMPSIAIVKSDMGHDKYGRISVVFNRDTIDPKVSKDNKVYSGDAYTPTFPRIGYKVDSKVARNIEKHIEELVGDKISDFGYLGLDSDNLTDYLERNNGDAAEAYYNKDALKYAFTKDKGIDIDVPMKERNLSLDFTNDEIKYIALMYTADSALKAFQNARDTYEEYSKNGYLDLIIEKINSFEKKYLGKLYENHRTKELSFSKFDQLLNSINKYYRDGIKEEVDRLAFNNKINEVINQNNAEYKQWLKELFDGVVEKKGIRNQKDTFTNSGSRRKWESLHDEYNLQNIVKAMKAEPEVGQGFGGFNIFGSTNRNFNSIEDIHSEENRLQNVDDDEYSKMKDDILMDLYDIAKRLIPSPGYDYTSIASDIAEAAAKRKTRSGIKSFLSEWYKVTEDDMDNIMNIIDRAKMLPTGYFEAKPRRVVGIDEIAYVVIPKNSNQNFIELLNKNNIPYEEYKAGDNEDRLEKLNSHDEVKFSKKEKTYGDIFAKGRDFAINPIEYSRIDQRLKENPGEKIKSGERAFILDNLLVYNKNKKVTGIVTADVKGEKDLTIATNILQEILDYEKDRSEYEGISFEELLKHEQSAYEKAFGRKVDITADSGSNLSWDARNELGKQKPVRNNLSFHFEDEQDGTGDIGESSRSEGDIIKKSLQDDWDYDWETAMAESEEEKIAEGMVAQNDVNILEDGFRALKDIKNSGKVNISHNKAVQIAKRYTEKYDSATGAESLATSIEAAFAYIREHDVSYDDMLRVMRDVTLPVVENIRGDEQFTEDYRDFVKSLKGTSISLNESQKKEVAYAYGSMANFRKAVAGRFNIKEDGVNIDSLWPEIVEQSGYRLDEEENSNSQPIALLELLDQMKSDKGTVNRGMSDNQLALDMALNIYTDCFKEMSMNAAKVNETEVAKRLAEILKDTVAKYEDAVDKMYKKMLADTKAQAQAEIDRLNQELRELNNIDTYNRSIDTDKRIIQLKRQIDRLKQQQEEDRVYRKTSRQKAKENRENSRMRNAIKSIVKDLSSRLANPNKNRYVPEDGNLVQATIDMLESINLDTKEGNLIKEKVQKVKDAYEKLGKSTNESDASDDYDPALYNMITSLKEIFDKGKSVRRLSQSELEDVLTIAKAIQTQIKNANELIKSEIAQKIDETARGVIEDVRANKEIGNGWLEDLANRGVNTVLDPRRFLNRLVGYNEDSKMMQLFDELNEGQHKMMQIQMETSDIFKGILENETEARKLTGENEKDWVETPFKDKKGNPLKIPAGMRLSLAMHMENEDNLRHIIYGGLTVPDMKLYNQGRKAEAYKKAQAEIRFIDDDTRLKLYEMRDKANELNDEQYTNQEREDAWAKYRDTVKKAEDQAKAKLQSIVDGMTDYEEQFLEYAKEYFWNYSGKQINETSMALNGYMKATVENYFPIATDTNYSKRDIEGLKLDQTLEGWGNLKSRVHAKNPIFLENIVDVISKHSDMMSKYAGLAIPIRNFNKVYNYNLRDNGSYKDSVMNAINSQRGVAATEYIENLLTDLQGSRKGFTGKIGEGLEKLRGNFAAATLTANLGVAIKQAASIYTAADVLGHDAIAHVTVGTNAAKHFWGSFTHVHKLDDYIVEQMEEIKKYSPLVWYRNQGNSTQELKDLKNKKTVLDKFAPTRFVKDKTYNWIQNIDTATVTTLWEAAKYRISKDTDLEYGSEEYFKEVAKIFNKAVEQTQPNYTTLQRPDILRNPNELVRNVIMFATQPLQNLGICVDSTANYLAKYEAYKNNQTEENKAKLDIAGKRLARSLSAVAVSMLVFSLMSMVAKAIRHKVDDYRDENGEITFESVMSQIFKDFGSSVAGMVPLGSEIYDYWAAKLTGGKYYGFEVSTIKMVTDFLGSVGKMCDSMIDLVFKGDTEKLGTNTKNFIFNTASMAGVPAKNIYNIVNGLLLTGQDVKKLINGEPWFFESGYTRSNTVNQNRLYEAMISGDNDKFDDVYAEMLQNGLTPDKIYGTSGSAGMMVKEDLLSGKYDVNQAIDYLEKLGMDEDSATEKAYGFLTTGLGDMETSDKVEYLEGFGVDEDYIYDKYSSDLKKDVQDQYEDGELSSSAAQAELKKMGYSDFDAYVTVNQWDWGSTADYAGILNAIKSEDTEKIIEAVNMYVANDYTKDQLKSYNGISSNFKEQYIDLYHTNKTEAASLKSAILTYYQACGMSREDAAKKVDKWVE